LAVSVFIYALVLLVLTGLMFRVKRLA